MLILTKNSRETEIKLLPQCAISFENQKQSQVFCKCLKILSFILKTDTHSYKINFFWSFLGLPVHQGYQLKSDKKTCHFQVGVRNSPAKGRPESFYFQGRRGALLGWSFNFQGYVDTPLHNLNVACMPKSHVFPPFNIKQQMHAFGQTPL